MASLMGIKSTEIDNQIKTWATLINIEHALDRKIRGYSKGMLQRLGFLVSILHNPKLIILDEPLSGLDPIGRKEFKDIMKKLHDNGTTIFFSSHILSDVEETCDHLVVLKDGKNFFQGKTVDLLSKNQDYQYEIGVRIESEEEGKKLFSTGRFKDGAYTFRCEKKDKNDIVKKALEHNLELLFLRSERPTLEEIIYDTRTE
jgi:ABC-2 type transport system ATP-binding protein